MLAHGDRRSHHLLLVQGSEDMARFPLRALRGLSLSPPTDLGVVLRTWNVQLLAADTAKVALEGCEKVASLTGVGTEAIWHWAFI